MKFKSAEADWNTSFVPQAERGRNCGGIWRGSCIDQKWVDRCTEQMAPAQLYRGDVPMKREFEFAGNFAMSVLLLAGSFAVAQNATTANAKKASSTTTTAAVAGTSSQSTPTAQATQAAAVTNSQTTESIVPPATAQNQPSTTTTKPKTMVSADKRTIPVPQL